MKPPSGWNDYYRTLLADIAEPESVVDSSEEFMAPLPVATDASVELSCIMVDESSVIALLVASVFASMEAVLWLHAARAKRETDATPRRTLFIQNEEKSKKETTL